jgi:hypothetical protein
LFEINADFEDIVTFETGHFSSIDAIIATGSDNAARYFEFYFSKYPNIIRKNRNGVAVLDGRASKDELVGLGRDIFSYFGLGCRSVSKLYVPREYNFNPLIESLTQFEYLKNHQKYYNNYWYNRARFMAQQIPVIDTGFLLLKEDKEIASPPGVLFFEYYDTPENLERTLCANKEKIQCIIGQNIALNTIDFGDSQDPGLWDYADNVDTIEFLISLNTSK